MTQADDNDLLAAEYVLGSLPTEERVDIDVRRATDPSLDLAIQQWEARLSPLLQSVEPVDPPADLLQRIEGQLFANMKGDEPNAKPFETGELVLLRRVKRWQGIAAGAFGLAAAITLVFGLRETGVLKAPQTDAPTSFVAMLQKDAASPAFVVSVNIATREMTIRPVAAEKANGKSYELWLVNKAFPAPRSLGVVDDQGRATGASLARYSPDLVKDSVFAVTLEPKGGSPTGNATGPVLFTGKLVEVSR